MGAAPARAGWGGRAARGRITSGVGCARCLRPEARRRGAAAGRAARRPNAIGREAGTPGHRGPAPGPSAACLEWCFPDDSANRAGTLASVRRGVPGSALGPTTGLHGHREPPGGSSPLRGRTEARADPEGPRPQVPALRAARVTALHVPGRRGRRPARPRRGAQEPGAPGGGRAGQGSTDTRGRS